MNSEELEQSLRTEFESYLKTVLAEVRQEVSEFQKQFEAEFEKHRSQIDDVFQNFSARLSAEKELDAGFTESVIEHLRLSRDEGARITATAIAEAEEIEKQKADEAAESATPTVSYNEIRDAINEISTKTTQSAILKTLVHHAATFTPRGAFFIIKNEHLVGWRVFAKDGDHADEQTVREVFFPVGSSTILGESVRSLAPVESAFGSYSDDSIYLNKLKFDHPEHMHAIPLVVRGRAVAALYADSGADSGTVNVEALETLVRVASLTVEVLASSRGAQPHEAEESTSEAAPAAFAQTYSEPAAETYSEPAADSYAQPEPEAASSYDYAAEAPVAEPEPAPAFESSYSFEAPAEEAFAYQPIEQPAEALEAPAEPEAEHDSFSYDAAEETPAPSFEVETTPSYDSSWNAPAETNDYYASEPAASFETPSYDIPEAPVQNDYAASLKSDYQFETTSSYELPKTDFEAAPTFEAPSYETSTYDAPASFETTHYEAEAFTPAGSAAFEPVAVETQTETIVAEPPPVVVEAPPKAKSRFSDRNVDLPIEVAEDERRLHNDARRFARLLVSEIKLYNEQKVKEGRDSSDLYDRLREAIDRSREMYDKRVQPPVAAKFDYFHYELVSSLAEGDEGRLGSAYPGATV